MLGFAVVSVQMRGSGCSGGAFDLFDLPTTYDGYDAVETVAAQNWVKGGKVGLAGISFSGITQLFVAGTRPPHLAAIAPMSVTDDTLHRHRLPGRHLQLGLRQDAGSRSAWTTPSRRPQGGQPYARELVKAGRQALHGQPEAAAADAERAQDPAAEPVPHAVAVRRSAPPGAVAQARQRADVPRRPVPGRADRRPLRRGARRT